PSLADASAAVGWQADVLHLEGGGAGVAGDGEGVRARAEVGGAEAEDVDALPAVVHPRDVVGDAGPVMAAGLGDHRADHRVVVDEARRLAGILPGEEALVAAAVVREVVGDGADEGEAVGDAGVPGEVLADLDAGDVG